MNESVPVLVTWLSPEEGGRETVFRGETYAPVARFPGPRETGEAWSVLMTLEPFTGGRTQRGTARFLVEAAPHDRFTPGTLFEVLEGSRCVARVEVVGPPGARSG